MTAAAGVGAVVLLWPAIYNGYPIVYVDSGEYLLSSRDFVTRLHPIFYALFLRVTHLKATLWGPIIVQALLSASLVRFLLGAYVPTASPLELVGILAVLAGATSASWFVAHVTPDAFSPLGVLSLFLLLFEWDRLRLGARLIVLAVLCAALLVHFSNLVVAGGLVAVSALVAATFRHRAFFAGVGRAAAVLAVVAFLTVANGLLTTGTMPASRGSLWLLGRLVQDGIVQRLLDDRCPHAAYALCPYRDALPATADAFLWKSPSPLYRIGGWDLPATHANAMILDSIRAYPLMHLRAFVRNTGAQLIRTHIEVSVETEDLFITRHIRRRFRREYPAFATSLQQQGRLVPPWLAPMHDWVIAASALGSLGLVALALTGVARPVTLPLHLFIWAALLLNAAVAANISDIVARYQGRLVWVMPLAVLMTLVTERRARTSTVIRTARTLDASDSDSVRGLVASSASGPSVIRRAPH